MTRQAFARAGATLVVGAVVFGAPLWSVLLIGGL